MKPKVKNKLLIGITGGIGSGKSEFCWMLQQKGYKVFYADLIAKQLYLKDKKLATAVVKGFGNDVLNFKGKLNLSKLREVIFLSKENYEKINKIVHPVVIEFIKREAKKAKEEVILIESALIFESGLDKYLDYIVTVYSNKKNRVSRIIQRDGAPKKEVENIMKYQKDEKEKIEKSDFVIVNNKSLAELEEQAEFVAKVLKLLKP